MRQLFLVMFFFLLAVSPASAREGDNYFFDWMTFYYQNKDPGRTGDFLAWMQDRKLVENTKTAIAPVAAFLSIIFADNPDKVDGWLKTTRFTGNTQQTIAMALWLAGDTSKIKDFIKPLPRYALKPAPKLSEITPDTTVALDMMWGAFSASGDPVYVKKAIDQLDSSNQVLKNAAEWSLTSNAKTHPKVRDIINEEINNRPEPVKTQLEQIIAGKTSQP